MFGLRRLGAIPITSEYIGGEMARSHAPSEATDLDVPIRERLSRSHEIRAGRYAVGAELHRIVEVSGDGDWGFAAQAGQQGGRFQRLRVVQHARHEAAEGVVRDAQ